MEIYDEYDDFNNMVKSKAWGYKYPAVTMMEYGVVTRSGMLMNGTDWVSDK